MDANAQRLDGQQLLFDLFDPHDDDHDHPDDYDDDNDDHDHDHDCDDNILPMSIMQLLVIMGIC